MKNLLFTLSFGFLLAQSLLAQMSSSNTFFVSPNPSTVFAPPEEYDSYDHVKIHNTTGATLNLRWTRVVIQLPSSMETQVCDCTLCWIASVGSRPFSIPANDSCDMLVHFINPEQVTGSGIVHLKINNTENLLDTLTAVYLYNPPGVSTDDLLPAPTVRLYPNPTVDYFMLNEAQDVAAVRIFSLDGRMLQYTPATPDQLYPISNLPAGSYVVALESANGRTFQVVELRKN